MDVPIEKLVFQKGGIFSVTHRGGISQDQLHVSTPDYSGRYQIQPDRSQIQMSFETGINAPRDFSGEGFFQISETKLILKNIWLGTFKAKQKPDICEMTFQRSSESEARQNTPK